MSKLMPNRILPRMRQLEDPDTAFLAVHLAYELLCVL
jgi:hypothetical protein